LVETDEQQGKEFRSGRNAQFALPPASDDLIVTRKQTSGVKKVFSPTQGSLGALLGGPLAGTYFVCMNFLALGKRNLAWLATICGAAIAVAITLWDLFRTEAMLNYSIVIFIAPAIIAWFTIVRTQFTKAQIVESSTLRVHSNWRVAGIALLGLLIFTVLGLGTNPHRR
jgi:hypothetical protein